MHAYLPASRHNNNNNNEIKLNPLCPSQYLSLSLLFLFKLCDRLRSCRGGSSAAQSVCQSRFQHPLINRYPRHSIRGVRAEVTTSDGGLKMDEAESLDPS